MTGDAAINLQNGDTIVSDSSIGLTDTQFTIGLWTENVSIDSGDNFHSFAKCGSTVTPSSNVSDLGDGWAIGLRGNTQFEAWHVDNGSATQFQQSLSNIDYSSDQLFTVATGNGDDLSVYIDNSNGLQEEFMKNGPRGTRSSGKLAFHGTGDDYVEGVYDDLLASTTTDLSKSEVKDLYQLTGVNYL